MADTAWRVDGRRGRAVDQGRGAGGAARVSGSGAVRVGLWGGIEGIRVALDPGERRAPQRRDREGLWKGIQRALGPDRTVSRRGGRGVLTRAPPEARPWRESRQALPERPRAAADPDGRLEDPQEVCPEGRYHASRVAAYAAAFVRHPPPGGRRGPPRGTGDAGTRRYFHDADLYSRRPRVPSHSASPIPSS